MEKNNYLIMCLFLCLGIYLCSKNLCLEKSVGSIEEQKETSECKKFGKSKPPGRAEFHSPGKENEPLSKVKKGYSPVKRIGARSGKSNSHVDIKAHYNSKESRSPLGFEIVNIIDIGKYVNLDIESNRPSAVNAKADSFHILRAN